MLCDPSARESYLVRLWTEEDSDQRILRGFIQNVHTGHKSYFHSLDLPVGLLRESAQRLATSDRAPLA